MEGCGDQVEKTGSLRGNGDSVSGGDDDSG